MRKLRWLSVVGTLCLISSALHGDSPSSLLLAANDYELEFSSQEEGKAALSSSIDAEEPWESSNEWRCFSERAVKLTCVDIDYGGWRKSPVIIVSSEEHRFEYDVDPTFHWDCEFTLGEWRRIIGDSAEVCFFGAHLQPLDEEASLWVLSQFKSKNGYWNEYESESYRNARRDLTEEEEWNEVEEQENNPNQEPRTSITQ